MDLYSQERRTRSGSAECFSTENGRRDHHGFCGHRGRHHPAQKNEEELRSSLAEVERFNKLMFTRELRVIEFEREVNELRKQHGEALLYTSVETETR